MTTAPPAAPPVPTPVRLRADAPARLVARVDSLEGLEDRRVVLVDDHPGAPADAPLGAADGEALAAGADLAHALGIPLVLVLSGRGSAVGDGVDALHAWGRAARAVTACSGRVPVVAVVTGPAVSGPALLLGLADVVVVTDQACTYVCGPRAVQDVTGLRVSADDLGGPRAHAAHTGLASSVAPDHHGALAAVAEVLAHLPDCCDRLPDRLATTDPVDRATPEAGARLPAAATGAYDVRDLVRDVVDDGELLELRARWAANLVTALATVDGRPVGVVANQPQHLAGTLDIAASQKAARFVATCDAFNVPLLTVVDTPGFSPGKDQEWRGMIRHGAQLAFAMARATVPRVSLTVRKSYGGAHIVMDSKTMGNDIALAWPTAEIAVMGAKGAVEILHRGEDATTRAQREADYAARFLTPWAAAERGLIDAVIDPADTRREVAAAFEVLATKREHLPERRHDNGPL